MLEHGYSKEISAGSTAKSTSGGICHHRQEQNTASQDTRSGLAPTELKRSSHLADKKTHFRSRSGRAPAFPSGAVIVNRSTLRCCSVRHKASRRRKGKCCLSRLAWHEVASRVDVTAGVASCVAMGVVQGKRRLHTVSAGEPLFQSWITVRGASYVQRLIGTRCHSSMACKDSFHQPPAPVSPVEVSLEVRVGVRKAVGKKIRAVIGSVELKEERHDVSHPVTGSLGGSVVEHLTRRDSLL